MNQCIECGLSFEPPSHCECYGCLYNYGTCDVFEYCPICDQEKQESLQGA